MAAEVPLYFLIGINPKKLSKLEKILLDMELFIRICDELLSIFKTQYPAYFYELNCYLEIEASMMEKNLIRFLIEDILATEEYTLQGIANYTNIHEDVFLEVLAGINTNPSAVLLRRIIELHTIVRRDLYEAIVKKIKSKYEQ